MLKRRTDNLGVSLIELVVGMAITATLLGMGAVNFLQWIQNSHIRGAAESIQSGLQFARMEAVRRNTPVWFQLVTSMDNNCTLSTTGPHWVVSLANAADTCGNPAAEPPPPPAPWAGGESYIIRKGVAAEGSENAVVASNSASAVYVGAVKFNGFGRVISDAESPGDIVQMNISNPSGGTCRLVGGELTCLRVVLTPDGQVRMCDPYITSVHPNDPGAC